jgi:hypothetical protein
LGKEHDVKISLVPALFLVFGICAVSLAADSDSDKPTGGQPTKEQKRDKADACGCRDGTAYICPMTDIFSTGTEDLWQCNYYPDSCNDIPEVAYEWEQPGFMPGAGPCPNGCDSVPSCPRLHGNLPATNLHALQYAFPADSPQIKTSNTDVVAQHCYFFVRASDPKAVTYICIYSLYHWEKDHTKCGRFSVGFEVNQPPTDTTISRGPLPNFETINDHMYTTELGGETVLILCTSCNPITAPQQQPTAAPTGSSAAKRTSAAQPASTGSY